MGQSFNIPPGLGLPSARELEQWQAECDRIDAQVAALARRKRGFEALIAAARQLCEEFGVPALDPQPDPPRTPASEAVSWADLRAEVLGRLPPRPAPRERPGRSGDDAPASRQPLVERASIIPYNTQLFVSAPPPQPPATGRPPAPPAPTAMAEAILTFLDRVSVGAPSAVIIAELRRTPHLAAEVAANKAQVLSLLSRLVDEGEVLKGGGVYYRNRQKPPRREAAE